MMRVAVRRVVLAVLAIAVVAAIVYAFLPEPVPVDVAEVGRASMLVTVDEEGMTRIKDRYVVSAPLAGRLRRIELDPGDVVEAEVTVVATIEPTDPNLLDARAHAEAEARVRAAEAAVKQAGAEVEQARTRLDFAENEHARVQDAAKRGGIAPQELDDAALLEKSALDGLRSRTFAEEIAHYEVELARSALLYTQVDASDDGGGVRFDIRAPITGRVLRVFQESVAVVTPGTALLEVGDSTDLEVVIDVLSTDAVTIEPGATVVIERWGGDHPLEAVVRLTEPSAFTKVSALGVEEQRVNVVADFVSPFEQRRTLGDGFRVEGRIVLWEDDDALQVPASALFRRGDRWAVFVVEEGRATLRLVDVGRRNTVTAQVLDGLEPGETVVVHPSDRVADGKAVEARGSS